MSSAVLVYETEDSSFADSCINALQEKGVECYRTGGSVVGGSTPTVCIYVRNAEDLANANIILIKVGAAIDEPIKLPSGSTVILIGIAVALLIIVVATHVK